MSLLLSLGIVLLVVLQVAQGASSSSAPYYYKYWCGHGHPYLDDASCSKIFPSNFDREWTCPIPSLQAPPSGYKPDVPYMDIEVDVDSLSSVISDSAVNLCMVLTKRVADESKPQKVALYHKYFCLGDRSKSDTFETWSSSKIFAMVNAAGHLRSNETACASGAVGLGGGVVSNSKHGTNNTLLGDLSTIICSYDETAGYTSNSLSSYFHDIGWRDRVNQVVLQQWLQAPASNTLGGNYGEATPSDLSFTIINGNDHNTCAVDKDPWPVKYSNSISALTAVELTRRLVHHRESDLDTRFPGVTWRDVQDILYGAESSLFFPGQLWGGMTSDTAIYAQSTAAVQRLLVQDTANLAQGQWRIFSKLGAGYSTSRYVGEIVTNSHVCIPSYQSDDDAQQPRLVGGLEVTLTARGSIPQDSSLRVVDARVQAAVDAALNFAAKFNEQQL